MRSGLRISVFTLAMICLFGLSVVNAENEKTYAVSGYVMDRETGESFSGARVILTRNDNSVRPGEAERFESVTDKNGRYHIDLEKGHYSIFVKYPNYIRKSMVSGLEVGEHWKEDGDLNFLLYYQLETIKVDLPPMPESLSAWPVLEEIKPSQHERQENARPVRVAVFKSFQSSGNASEDRWLDSYIDLLSVALSQQKGFEVVDRASVNNILNEITVGLVNEQPDKMALRAGRLVNARLAITGTLIQGENASAAIVRITDTTEGFIRDIFTIPLTKDRIEESVRQSVIMISGLTDDNPQLKNRPIVAIGSFEDESLNNRFIRLDEDLRTYLQQHFMGQLPVVERVLVPPLLMELEMGTGGFTETTIDQSRVQPAVILIDGVYKAFRQETDMISLTIRAHQIGGAIYYTTLDLPPGESLKTGAAYAADRLLEKINSLPPVLNSRSQEAKVHMERGKKLLGIKEKSGDLFHFNFFNDASHKTNDFNQAISAFESAAVLIPESDLPRLYLGLCYANPIVQDYDRGFEYFEDILSNATEEKAKLRVINLLKGYITKDEFKDNAFVLKTIRNILPDIPADEKLSLGWKRPMYQLAVKGMISEEDYRQYNIDFYQGYMDRILEKCPAGYNPDLIKLIREFCFMRGGVVGGTRAPELDKFGLIEHRLREKYFQQITKIVTEKYPRLLPYFIARYVYWRSKYVNSENDPVNEMLREMIQNISQNRDNVDNYEVFCRRHLSSCYNWAKQCGYYETAVQIGEMLLEYSKSNIGSIADCYCRLKDYKSALRVLKQSDNPDKSLRGCFGKLGARNIFEAISICETKLGAARDSVNTFVLPSPVLTFDDIAGFDFYKNECWLSIGTRIAEYDLGNNKLHTRGLLTDTRRSIRFLAAGSDNIYLSNKLKGLYIFNKHTGEVKIATGNEGLPLGRIPALYYTTDRLWMGFSGGREEGGDIGYWDLAQQNYTGLSASRRDSSGAYRSSPDGPSDPPNRPVVGICQSPPDNLWVAVLGKGLQRYDLATGKWRTWTNSERVVSDYDKTTHKMSRKTVYTSIMDHENMVSCVAANDIYVAVGCVRTNRGPKPGQVLGGLSIYQYNHKKDERKASKSLSMGSGTSFRKKSAGMSPGAASSAEKPLFSKAKPHKKSSGLSLGAGTPSKKIYSPALIKGRSPSAKYWTRLGSHEGLPDNEVFSVAFSPGNELWVGGKNFVAIVDLDTRKIKRVCNLENRVIRKIQVVNNEVWILAFKTNSVVFLGGYGVAGSEIYRIPL